MKEGNLKTMNTLLSRAFIQMDGEIRDFINKQKLKEFSTTKSALQRNVKRSFLSEKEGNTSRNTNYERKKEHWPRQICSKGVNQPCKISKKKKKQNYLRDAQNKNT